MGFRLRRDENIVEVYVRYLRRKIDLPFERRAIETVRGAGYRSQTTVVEPSSTTGRTPRTPRVHTATSRVGSVRAKATIAAVVVVGVAMAIAPSSHQPPARVDDRRSGNHRPGQLNDVASLLRLGPYRRSCQPGGATRSRRSFRMAKSSPPRPPRLNHRQSAPSSPARKAW